jgi:hypothetical protein
MKSSINLNLPKGRIKYKRIGDDTFLVLVEGQRPIKGRLKNFMNGLMDKSGNGHTPSQRSDLKWLTDKQYHGK